MMIKYSVIAVCLMTLIAGPAVKASAHQEPQNPRHSPISTSNHKISDLLNTALKNYPGRLIELERKQKNRVVYYKIKILSVQGNIIELSFQAIGTGFREIKNEQEGLEKDQKLFTQKTLLPLDEILKRISFKTLLDVELKTNQSQVQYEVKWLDPQGQIKQAFFDATTGQKINR